MNKKQQILVCAMGLLGVLCIVSPFTISTHRNDGKVHTMKKKTYIVEPVGIIFAIGGLLLYVLRDKKRKE